MQKYSRANLNNVFAILLITQFAFFIILNKYFFFYKQSNNFFILIPIIILFVSVILVYTYLFFLNKHSIKNLKFFINSNKDIIISIILICITSILSRLLNDENNFSLKSESLKVLVKYLNLNLIYDYYLIIFFLFFLFNLYIFKLHEKNRSLCVFDILLKFSIFYLIYALLINFVFYFFEFFKFDNSWFVYFADTDNCIYFQFLPIGISGKRHYEIIVFLIGYVLTFNNKNYGKLNIIFFIVCALSFSRNLWIAILFINFFNIIFTKRLVIFLNLIKKMAILFLSIIVLNFIFTNFTKKNCNPGILNYSLIKSLSLINILKIKYLDNLIYKNTGKLDSFRVYNDKRDNNEFINDTLILLDSTPKRIEIYKESVKKIIKKPLIGYGFNNYRLSSNQSINSESQILKIFLDGGILGIIVWFLFVFKFYCKIKSYWQLNIFLALLSLSLLNIYSWFPFLYTILPLLLITPSDRKNLKNTFFSNKLK